jgi:hypothetical protein
MKTHLALIEKEIQIIENAISNIISKRYSLGRFKRFRDFGFLDSFFSCDEKEFLEHMRMKHNTFLFILNKIKYHPIFGSFSNNPQRPVFQQLAVVLELFGLHGNGASLGRFSRRWGIGHGSVVLYRSRVI